MFRLNNNRQWKEDAKGAHLGFGLKTTKSTKCIVKKENLDKQRLECSNQRKNRKEKGVVRS